MRTIKEPLNYPKTRDSSDALLNHIDVAYHFVHEKVNDKSINMKYCSTDRMLADIMTKGLPRQTFQKFRNMLNVKEI